MSWRRKRKEQRLSDMCLLLQFQTAGAGLRGASERDAGMEQPFRRDIIEGRGGACHSLSPREWWVEGEDVS
jgi:hypothetical protein